MTPLSTRPLFSSNILADCTADEFSVSFKAMRIDVRRDGDGYAVSHMMIEVLYKGDVPSQPIPITKKSIGELLDTAQSGLGYIVTSEHIETLSDLTAARVRARFVEEAWVGPQWDILDNMWARVPDAWPMPVILQPFPLAPSTTRARKIDLRLI